MFIVFEGVDGAGKSGFIQPFKEMLEEMTERKIVTTREPGGTPFGEALRKVILSKEHNCSPMTELLTMMTIRLEHINGFIKPALEEGHIVLCDRFHLSTLAFQCIPNNISEDVYYDLHHSLYGEFYPDLTVLFSTDRVVINERKVLDANDRFESRDSTFYDQLDSFYQETAKGTTMSLFNSISVIDNNGSKDHTLFQLKKLALSVSSLLR